LGLHLQGVAVQGWEGATHQREYAARAEMDLDGGKTIYRRKKMMEGRDRDEEGANNAIRPRTEGQYRAEE
jgi:hypothetical protein